MTNLPKNEGIFVMPLSQHNYRWMCQYLLIHPFFTRFPLCRPMFVTTLSNIQIFPDKACHREILRLDVYCTYAASGCDWRGKLKELDVRK